MQQEVNTSVAMSTCNKLIGYLKSVEGKNAQRKNGQINVAKNHAEDPGLGLCDMVLQQRMLFFWYMLF